jgi:hypothetical protein
LQQFALVPQGIYLVLSKVIDCLDFIAMSCDDDWDKVVNLEAYAYEKGKIEAVVESQSHDEAYTHGRINGLQRGYAVAFELSFYATNIDKLLASLSAEEHLSGRENPNLQLKDRLHRRCHQLLEKYASLPDNNRPDFDFEALINEMRTLYKLIGKDREIPAFKPVLKEEQRTHDW